MSSSARKTTETRVISRALIDRIAVVSISRAEKLNSLRARDKRALADEIESLSTNGDVRAIVVTGEGDRAFCAGSDIDEMRHFVVAEMYSMLADERAMYLSVLRSPKPVVAAINGYALGAGLILGMVADYSVAATTAQLGTPELTIGVAAPLEGLLLPSLVGLARARELFYLGERIDAEQAQRIGLVNTLAPTNQVVKDASAIASRLAELPGDGFRTQKRLLSRLLSTGDLEGAIVESHYATSLQFGGDATARAMDEFLTGKERACKRAGRADGAASALDR
jgi:enoyl-CoA hydratase/carnithine racemase